MNYKILFFAIAFLTTMVACGPKCDTLDKAAELISNGQGNEALEFLNDYIAENPQEADALFLRMHIYYDNGQGDAALADASKAIEYWKEGDKCKKHTILYWRATMYANSFDNPRAAVEDYNATEALIAGNDVDSIMPMLLYDRAEAYDKLGNTTKAIDDAIAFLFLYSDYFYDEMMAILRKDLPYAISKVEQADLMTGAQNPKLRQFIATLCVENKEYRYAITVLNSCEEDFGAVPPLYAMRGECYKELGRYEKAVLEADKAMELLSKDEEDYRIDLRLLKIECCRLAGMYEEAIKECTFLIDDAGEDVFMGLYYYRGWCYELMGDDKAAMRDYNKGIEVDEEYAYTYLMRGEQYLKLGEKEKARADFEQILKLDTVPEDGSCRHYALHFTGNDKEALEWMERVADACGHDAGSYYDKACLLCRMGRESDAVAALSTALEKGFYSFAHIENDDDLDPIRNRKDFKRLIEKYKAKAIEE